MSYECYAIGELLSMFFCCRTLKELDYNNNEKFRDLYFQKDKILRKERYKEEKKKRNFQNPEKEKVYELIFLETDSLIQQNYDDKKERKKFYAIEI